LGAPDRRHESPGSADPSPERGAARGRWPTLEQRIDARSPMLHRDRYSKSAPVAPLLIASASPSRLDGSVLSSERCGGAERGGWAQVRALAADGIAQGEIAQRRGSIGGRSPGWRGAMSRRVTGGRRPGRSSIRWSRCCGGLLEEWPRIKAPRLTEVLRDEYGDSGSVRLVQARLQRLRPRGGAAGAADGLPARPGAAA
jgi:hypothetical protein